MPSVVQMQDAFYFVFVQQSAWWASAISLTMMWQMGNKRSWAPWLGIFGQVFWLMLAIFTAQWGLLPACAAYTIVHLRNGLKWRAERQKEEEIAWRIALRR